MFYLRARDWCLTNPDHSHGIPIKLRVNQIPYTPSDQALVSRYAGFIYDVSIPLATNAVSATAKAVVNASMNETA